MSDKEIRIRTASREDAGLILGFITELAIYEKAEHEVLATRADIERSLSVEDGGPEALICSANNEDIGFALYFFNYSTWLGKPGLFLEDLYISPDHRGTGAGKALLVHLAKLAKEKDCGRFEWNVLDWNEPAIRFYQSLGARPLNEWITYRLDADGIAKLAGGIESS